MGKSSHYRDESAIKEFGKKVRALRVKKDMTIEEFANSVDLHVTQVSRIERGETNPTLSYIFLLAEKLGVKPSDLIDFELTHGKTKKAGEVVNPTPTHYFSEKKPMD